MKNNVENKDNRDFKRMYEALREATKLSITDLMTGETKDVGLEITHGQEGQRLCR